MFKLYSSAHYEKAVFFAGLNGKKYRFFVLDGHEDGHKDGHLGVCKNEMCLKDGHKDGQKRVFFMYIDIGILVLKLKIK